MIPVVLAVSLVWTGNAAVATTPDAEGTVEPSPATPMGESEVPMDAVDQPVGGPGRDDTTLTPATSGQTAEPEAAESEAGEPPDAVADPGDEDTLTSNPAVDEQASPDGGELDVIEDVLVAASPVSGVAVLGVTWEEGEATDPSVIEMRWQTDGTWSEWATVETEQLSVDDGAEPPGDGHDLRAGTEPVVVVGAQLVEARVVPGHAAMPDIKLVVVDQSTPSERNTLEETETETEIVPQPERGTAGGSALSRLSGAASGVLPAATLAVGSARPTIYSRAQWGADESKMTWTPQTGRVDGAVVHHTAGSNSYSSNQVPAILRGIYTYHAVSRGWGDIGYNVLVDKYGRAWEGRAGGLERAVIGAHARGVNSTTFGISVIGNYDTASVSSSVVTTLQRVIAWKFDLHGTSRSGTATIDGARRSTILGHRDVGQTSCPGVHLYGKLAGIRTAVAAIRAEADRSAETERDLDGDGMPELLATSSSSVSLLDDEHVGWSRDTFGPGWSGDRTYAAGDWTGDGYPDLILVQADGDLMLYAGTSSGNWSSPRQIGTDWSGFTALATGHDWTGDRKPDILARTRGGDLRLYPGDGRGGFGSSRTVGWKWNGMSEITLLGPWRGGPALAARDADGRLQLYRGDGKGGFAVGRVAIGTGWSSMSHLTGPGDVDGDGRGDLVAVSPQGDLRLYRGTANGGVEYAERLGTSWSGFTAVDSLGRPGRGQAFAAVDRSGRLSVYDYGGSRFVEDLRATSIVPSQTMDRSVAAGDWDGDGRDDVLIVARSGDLYLHAGTGGGEFRSVGRKVGHGWDTLDDIVAGGDWTGSGAPTLIALDRSAGRVALYVGDGRGGFASSSTIGSGVSGVDMLVSPGMWSGRTRPDLLTRDGRTGTLTLWYGTGGAGLVRAKDVGWNWGSFSQIVGAGDLSDDGRPDIVARTTSGDLVLYPGNGRGGFTSSSLLGAVPRERTIS